MTNKFQEQSKRAKAHLDALPAHARPVVTRPLVSSTATIRRMPRPRGELTADQMRRYVRAENKLDDAKDELRRVVLAIMAEGASFSEVSGATGLSTNTLQRWKREASK